jgi:hypothetical protein
MWVAAVTIAVTIVTLVANYPNRLEVHPIAADARFFH